MDPDDVGGPEEEEGPSGKDGRGDDVGLDRGLAALVAKHAPDRRGDRVGTVLQPEEKADVEGTQLKVSQDLKRREEERERTIKMPQGQC